MASNAYMQIREAEEVSRIVSMPKAPEPLAMDALGVPERPEDRAARIVAALTPEQRTTVFSETELEAMTVEERARREGEILLAVREGRIIPKGEQQTLAARVRSEDTTPLYTERQIESMSPEQLRTEMPAIRRAAAAGRILTKEDEDRQSGTGR